MFHATIDLGQIILAAMIGTIGFLVKRTIDKFESRLDKSEEAIFELSGAVQRLIGRLEVQDERRKNIR